MKFAVILFALFVISCKDKDKASQNDERRFYSTYTHELEDSVRTLDLMYVNFACACAQWISPADHEKYQDSDKLSQYTFFTEAADSTLELPDTIGYTGDVVRFTGKFYKEKGYPRNYQQTEESVEKAKVFRYTSYQIIESRYRYYNESIK